MDFYVILNEIKEFADECVQKYREECLKASDSVIINYLKTLMYPEDFQIFLKYKKIMLDEFRKFAKESLEWLNS